MSNQHKAGHYYFSIIVCPAVSHCSYPSDIAVGFQGRYNCSHWPDQNDDSPTPTPPCPSTAATFVWITNSQYNEPDVKIAAGSRVSGLGLGLQLVLTAISLLLVQCL